MEIDWRGYQLRPDTPPGGRKLSDIYGARVPAMHRHLVEFAREFGIEDIRPRDHISNTRRVIAMAEYARDQGRLEPFRLSAMDAYWRDQEDLEDDAVLRALAAGAGLDPEAALAASRDPAYLGRIDDRRREAEAIGITGIPTFVIDGQGVVGCQPYEVLEAFVKEVGGAKRRIRDGN